jgi:aromatic-L-amino-acid decarboxylase
MNPGDFRAHAHELVDWMADYLEQVERLPVKPDLQPGTVLKQLPLAPPDDGEPFSAVFRDFREIILPGMTHWQHPSFFAYFPANSSPPSILAEMLTATLGAQCMSWATSPAATELEERVMEWLRTMIGLPSTFTGVIQDTASTATLCALLTARERRSAFRINERGFAAEMRFTVYCSAEAHSSIEKAAKIAGFGREYLRKIRVDDDFALIPSALDEAVTRDLRLGYTPLCVVAAVGTTGSTGLDPLRPIAALCRKHGIWLHVDAAYAGSALLLPEFRWIADGVEEADSVVFNPHKWLLTNFDCSAYFVRDVEALVRTFEILPEYLKTPEGDRVKNYRDWGIQLGRRFRALKLWFVIRTYGVHGLQQFLRTQIAMAQRLARRVQSTPGFQILAPVPLNVICFRYAPSGLTEPAALDALNVRLLESLNQTGLLYLSHTRLAGRFTLRLVVGQTYVQQHHVDEAWERIVATAQGL